MSETIHKYLSKERERLIELIKLKNGYQCNKKLSKLLKIEMHRNG